MNSLEATLTMMDAEPVTAAAIRELIFQQIAFDRKEDSTGGSEDLIVALIRAYVEALEIQFEKQDNPKALNCLSGDAAHFEYVRTYEQAYVSVEPNARFENGEVILPDYLRDGVQVPLGLLRKIARFEGIMDAKRLQDVREYYRKREGVAGQA